MTVESVSFVASPTGKRVGLLALSDGRTEALVTVVPKLFADASVARRVDSTSWIVGGRNRIVLAETQFLQVFSAPAAEFLSRAVKEIELEARAAKKTALLELTTRVGPNFEDGAIADDAQEDDLIVALLRFLERVDALEAGDDAVAGIDSKSPIFRPLLVRRFLNEVSRCLPRARRGYKHRMAQLTAIRGRATARGIAEYQSSGIPVIECVFDELTESTDLLAVIASALQLIAAGAGARSILPGAYSEAQLRADAVALRREMPEIPWLSPDVAARLGRGMRLSRLDAIWGEALHSATTLLSGGAVSIGGGTGPRFGPVELSVGTERLWERVVTEVLETLVEPRNVLTPGKRNLRGVAARPWSDERWRPQPDNVVFRARDTIVVDAKYKKFLGSPKRDDQYQLFTYSHVVGNRSRRVSHAALFYPSGDVPIEDNLDDPGYPEQGEADAGALVPLKEFPGASWSRRRYGVDDVYLHAVELQFPDRSALEGSASWLNYIATLALQVELFLAGLDASD